MLRLTLRHFDAVCSQVVPAQALEALNKNDVKSYGVCMRVRHLQALLNGKYEGYEPTILEAFGRTILRQSQVRKDTQNS